MHFERRRRVRGLQTLVLALVAIGLLANPLAARELTGFESNDDYALTVGGAAAPSAEVYWSVGARSFLIVASEFASPVLLSPAGSRVRSVPILQLVKRDDGTIDVLSESGMTDQGLLAFEGGVVRFNVDSVSVEMVRKPPLLGWHDREGISDYSALFERRAVLYEPDMKVVEKLRALETEATLAVYFGSWCSHCQKKVPMAMKLAELLEDSNVKIRFYGVPERIQDDPLASRLGLKGVPTGVVLIDDREVDRLVGKSWDAPEVALLRILAR